MRKKKTMTAIERYDAIQKIGTEVDVPHYAWTTFMPEYRSISIVGTDICLGEDYKSIEQARAGIEFYVTQLGGTVKWKP